MTRRAVSGMRSVPVVPAAGQPVAWRRCSRSHAQLLPAASLPLHPPLPSSPAGQAEPLALDAAGKPLTLLHQCCVEQRAVGEDGADSVVRCVVCVSR